MGNTAGHAANRPKDRAGFADALAEIAERGRPCVLVAVEGTRGYCVRRTRALTAADLRVVEVGRQRRSGESR